MDDNHSLTVATHSRRKHGGRVGTSQGATTFAQVNELDQEAKKLFEELKEWKRLNPDYLFDVRLKAIYKEKDQN